MTDHVVNHNIQVGDEIVVDGCLFDVMDLKEDYGLLLSNGSWLYFDLFYG